MSKMLRISLVAPALVCSPTSHRGKDSAALITRIIGSGEGLASSGGGGGSITL